MTSTNAVSPRLSFLVAATCVVLAVLGCKTRTGSHTADADPALSATPATAATPLPVGPNVMRVTVNGDLCLDAKYTNINEPCTSVTICVPGTGNCQTISGILVDTGSTGLRLFASVVTLKLPQVPSGSGTLASCEAFSGGKSSWGSMVQADVILGAEPAVTTAIDLINSKYATPTGPCDPAQSDLDTTPEDSGFNGILGVSHHAQNCGTSCTTNADNGQYFSCTPSGCVSTVTPVQLVSPVALLPVDNNGVVLTLPAVPPQGAASVTGALVLGIGTQANNTPAGVKVFPTDDFATTFTAFSPTPINSGTIDSGSSRLYFPKIAATPVCDPESGVADALQTGPLCPTQPQTLTATMSSGSTTNLVTFTVTDASAMQNSGNSVSASYASAVSTTDPYFMWGLPFFFGRSVYIGFDGKASSLGTGPYWAY